MCVCVCVCVCVLTVSHSFCWRALEQDGVQCTSCSLAHLTEWMVHAVTTAEHTYSFTPLCIVSFNRCIPYIIYNCIFITLNEDYMSVRPCSPFIKRLNMLLSEILHSQTEADIEGWDCSVRPARTLPVGQHSSRVCPDVGLKVYRLPAGSLCDQSSVVYLHIFGVFGLSFAGWPHLGVHLSHLRAFLGGQLLAQVGSFSFRGTASDFFRCGLCKCLHVLCAPWWSSLSVLVLLQGWRDAASSTASSTNICW